MSRLHFVYLMSTLLIVLAQQHGEKDPIYLVISVIFSVLFANIIAWLCDKGGKVQL